MYVRGYIKKFDVFLAVWRYVAKYFVVRSEKR